MSLKSMSDTQLLNECKKRDIKLVGVYSKNELPDEKKEGNYIINMQSYETPKDKGTHWVACIKSPNKGTNIYFDSFGAIAPIEIANFLGEYKYNKREIQDYDSESCGWFCIDFLNSMKNKADLKNFEMYISKFKDNTLENDNILKRSL